MLAMGRALMKPPAPDRSRRAVDGSVPLYVNEIFDIIQEINKDGVTVLLVEQNAKKRSPFPIKHMCLRRAISF